MPIFESQVDRTSDDYDRNRERMLAAIAEFRDNSGSYSIEARRAVQQFLIDRGLLADIADGTLGDEDRAALDRWRAGG